MITQQEQEELNALMAATETLLAEDEAKAEPAPEPKPAEVIEKALTRKPAGRPRKDGAARLICSETGKPMSCLANAISILRGFDPQWLGVLAYDEFANRIVTRKSPPWGGTAGTWDPSDDVRAADFLNHKGIFVSSKIAQQAADVAARDCIFNPVREFLRSLKWDGKPRLDNWLSTYLGAEASAWTRAAGSKWLISGVARILIPGCQADYLLLLIGPQGTMKSSALQILAGAEWFRDDISSITNKDSKIELQGKWIVELGELSAARSATHEAMKAFLTRRVENYRPVYGTRNMDFPRQCIFSASTNAKYSLTDETGSRRFWPVTVGRINLDALRRDRAQIWAEACFRYQAGESWWLNTREQNALAESEQDKNYASGPYDDKILDWCESPRGGSANMLSVRGRIVIAELSEFSLGVSIGAPHYAKVQREITRCLTHHHWIPPSGQQRIPGTNQRARFWTAPDQE